MKVLVLFLPSFPLRAVPLVPQGIIGTKANPKRVLRLQTTKLGVHENYLMDTHGRTK